MKSLGLKLLFSISILFNTWPLYAAEELQTSDTCRNCTNKKSTGVKKLKILAGKVREDIDIQSKKESQNKNKVVSACNGQLNFNNLKATLQKINGKCIATFNNECEPTGKAKLLVFEELSNSILFTGSSEAKKVCTAVDDAYRNECGINAGIKDSVAEQIIAFSEVRDIVGNKLIEAQVKPPINEGVMMCLFNLETTNFDASKMNYTVCDPKSYGAKNNLNQRRKPAQINNNENFILKGVSSSAMGLGQVTLETMCGVMRANLNKYPQLAGLKDLPCSSVVAKKMVEPYFLQMGDSRELQVEIAIATLQQKLSATKNIRAAIKAYDGDDRHGTFVSFVMGCSQCFINKKWKNDEVYGCMQKKRLEILRAK